MENILNKMDSIIFSQNHNIRLILASILAGGHVLLEGVPGLGKTKMVKTMATLMGGEYKRIQFTPDMMPSDVTGNMIFNMKENRFETIKGPIFTNWLLADEINRTPPKTQAALLEAMEERQVTIHGETYPLPDPFFVIATQNPVEYEGTYRLPEAQLDRFFFKILIDYPTLEGEKQMLTAHRPYYEKSESHVQEIYSIEDLRNKRKELERIVVEDSIVDYITSIIRKTRDSNRIQLGASPRASIALLTASKAWALIDGRDYVTPDDVKLISLPVLRHRIIVTPQVELEGGSSDQIIKETLASIPVPR